MPSSPSGLGASGALLRYGAALLSMAVALLVRWPLYPVLGTQRPYLTLFGGVAFAVWFARWRPAAVAAVAGFIATNYFIVPPHDAIKVDALLFVETAAYSISTGLIIFFGEAMHRARERTEQEVVERQRAHDAELRQKNLLAVTLASIGDGVIVTDADGRVTSLNAEAERLTRWSTAEAVGQPLSAVFRIIHELTRKPAESPVDKVIARGTVVGLANHTLLLAKDGTELPIDDSAAPIRTPDGPLLGVVLVFRDCSEQRKAEEVRARLATIVESSGDAILSKTLEGKILTWNAAAGAMFGYAPEEVVGKPVTTIIPPELHGEEAEILESLRRGRAHRRLETVRVAKDGRRVPVLLTASPIKDSEGRVIGASKILHDIRETLAAREALARERNLLRTTLASIGDGVLVTDARGRVTFLNAEAERLTGWTSAEAQGKELPEVFRIVNETTRKSVENPVEKVFRLGQVVGLANHTILIARDGTETPIDDSAAPIQEPGGPLFGVVLVFRDFTEHKKAEAAVKQAREDLVRANASLEGAVQDRTAKLREMVEELQHVSYSITHDMRAPLRAMTAFTQMLVESAGNLPAESQDYCRRILTGAGRLDRLIQDALSYSRAVLQDLPLEPVDLSKLVRGLLETYPNFHPEKADLTIDGELPVLLGNEALLTQCFSNLLGNAVKFVAPGTRSRVRIWSETGPTSAKIWIQDNGIGIPAHAQKRLFGMFQKLDNEYEGTGIGLAIVRKVVERMGGLVGVESEPGKGSRFWVKLRRPPE